MFATALLLLGLSGQASATGPGGWGHLGDGGTTGTPSLNGAVDALNSDRPNTLYVGGSFTDAGGVPSADRIASWNGSAWSAVSSPSSQISNGAVNAIAYDAATGHVFAGGTFTDAGGNANADFLAVWNGTGWAPFCNGTSPPITATVYALQIIGRTLYVAGSFADGAGIASADRLVACNLDTGASSSTVIDQAHEFTGTVYALAADSNGTLYAGGGFTDLGGEAAADNVAYLDSGGVGWHAMGSGGGACSCAVDDFVRSLTAVGTDVYVGTDALDVAGIAQADHVVRWSGSSWSAVGANTAGTDGWFPTSSFINGLTDDGTDIYATGSFQNANGDPTADFIASFKAGDWHPVGSDGAGNGPWSGNGLAVAAVDLPGDSLPQQLYAGGSFTSAGGDTQARYLASYAVAHTLTVTVVGTGTGTVQSTQIHCPPTCVGTYATGTKVSLSAVTPPGSEFLGFTGDCTGAGGCDVTLDSNKAVTATYSLPPVCADQSITATGTVAVQLQCSNPGGGSLFYYIPIVSGPHHGTLGELDVNGLPHGDGKLTYTPAPGYVGPDGFTYGALLDAGSILPAFSNEATLRIDVVDATKPQISKLALSTTTFRAAGSGPSISSVKIGTMASFSLSEASSVRFSVSRAGKGPKPKGSFKFAGKKGANRFTFRGRIGGRKLVPGRYQLIARATDRSKNSSLPKRVGFTIVR